MQLSVKVLPGLLLIRCSSLGVQYLFVQSLYHGVVLHQAFVVRHQGLPVVHDALIMMLERLVIGVLPNVCRVKAVGLLGVFSSKP